MLDYAEFGFSVCRISTDTKDEPIREMLLIPPLQRLLHFLRIRDTACRFFRAGHAHVESSSLQWQFDPTGHSKSRL
jgi:hypothetical protein